MKKSTIKLTSALLMLNLMGTSLHAATMSLEDNVSNNKAATRIQRMVRFKIDRNLNRDFDDIFQKESTAENIQNDTEFAEQCLRESIDSLDELSSRSEIAAPLVSLFDAIGRFPDIVELYLQSYQTYLQSQQKSTNPVKRQWASIIKAFLVDLDYYKKDKGNNIDRFSKLSETKRLLEETQNSSYPFFRFYSYERLSKAYLRLAESFSWQDNQYTENRKAAIVELERGLDLPGEYPASVESKRLSNKLCLQEHKQCRQIIETGNRYEKANARYDLSYLLWGDPEQLDLRRALVNDDVRVASIIYPFSFIPAYDMQISLANSLNADPKNLENKKEADTIINSILEKYDYADIDYARAVYLIIEGVGHTNLGRILELSSKFLSHPDFSTTYKKKIELVQLLQAYVGYFPEVIRGPEEAVRILEKYSGDSEDSVWRSKVDWVLKQFNFASETTWGAIGGLTKKKCYERLLPLCERPSDQLQVLTKLMTLYLTEGETFTPGEVETIAKKILDHSFAGEETRLSVYDRLLEFYERYPDLLPESERKKEINRMIIEEIKANEIISFDNRRRLIKAYIADNNNEEALKEYKYIFKHNISKRIIPSSELIGFNKEYTLFKKKLSSEK